MILQIRGTSGSGKSTAMRKVIEAIAPLKTGWKPHFIPGRKQPLYYRRGGLIVLGHYEIPCGGCDTVGNVQDIFNLIQELSKVPCCILAEGLLLSEDVKWTTQLTSEVKLAFLTTPTDVCLDRIEARRSERGVERNRPLNRNKTIDRAAQIDRARLRLIEAGIECRRCSADQAPQVVFDWIGLKLKKAVIV